MPIRFKTKCLSCGGEILVTLSEAKYGKGSLCSQECQKEFWSEGCKWRKASDLEKARVRLVKGIRATISRRIWERTAETRAAKERVKLERERKEHEKFLERLREKALNDPDYDSLASRRLSLGEDIHTEQ
jgi:hypothetical protein